MKGGIIHKKRHTKRAPCTLYTGPTASSTIAAFVPTTLTWDSGCYSQLASDSPSAIDIYLYNATKPIYAWRGVGLSTGRLDVVLDSAWWGNASESRVHLQFLASGSPLWDTTVPSGPIFLASYNGTYPSSSPSSSSTPTDTDGFHFSSIDLSPSSGGLSGGKLAAAVVMPLLAVASLVIGYVAYTRFKTRKKTRRYSAAVDQRMSAMNVPGWQPGLVGSARPSMSSQRPGSYRHSAAFTARHSAFLAAAPQAHLAGPPSPRLEMTQNPNRSSRISFAPSTDVTAKRYSLAAGAGPMSATNKGHGKGPGSTASAFSAYSNNTFAPAHLRGGPGPNAGHRPMPSGSSALRRQVDDLQLSPDQAASPIAIAGHFSPAPAPSRSPVPPSPASSNFAFNTNASPTKRAVPGRAQLVPDESGQQKKTESVVSQSAALMDELNAMGPAIQAIVSGEADGEKMEVVGRTGWDDIDEEDEDARADSSMGIGAGAQRQAPRPPMASPYLAAMDGQGNVEKGRAAGLGKGKKGILAGLGGWRKRDGAKEAGGKLVIGQPQIVPGSNLDEASRNGVMIGRGFYDAQ